MRHKVDVKHDMYCILSFDIVETCATFTFASNFVITLLHVILHNCDSVTFIDCANHA